MLDGWDKNFCRNTSADGSWSSMLMKLISNFKLIDTYNRSLYEAGIGFGKYYSEYPDLILGLELSTQPHKTQLLLECQLW